MNSVFNIKEFGLWLATIVVTAISFFLTYYYNFSAPVKVIVWILWLVLTGMLVYFTSVGQRVFVFCTEAKIELLKVVWPTRQETVQTTSIVMVMVAATGFILWLVDSGMMWIIAKITQLG